MRKAIVLVLVAAAGAVTASLSFPHTASAWDWHSLPAGYGVSSYTTVCDAQTDPCITDGMTCNHLTVTAPNATPHTFAETDCVNPSFQADLDGFVDATICTVNPSAGGTACAPATTTTAVSATTTATVAQTTTSASPAQTTTVTQTAPTNTVTVTNVAAATAPAATPGTSDLDARLTAIEQRLDVDEARIQALEDHVAVLGETKNEPPFTNPA